MKILDFLQEVQLSQCEAANRIEIRSLPVLLVGRLQQDEVGHAHRVQGFRRCQVRGGATHLSPLIAGESYHELLILWSFYQCVPYF